MGRVAAGAHDGRDKTADGWNEPAEKHCDDAKAFNHRFCPSYFLLVTGKESRVLQAMLECPADPETTLVASHGAQRGQHGNSRQARDAQFIEGSCYRNQDCPGDEQADAYERLGEGK